MTLPRLIDPTEFTHHIDRNDLLIVDLSSAENYAIGHISGAVSVLPGEIVDGGPPVPGRLPPIEKLRQTLSRIGYHREHHVVAVDDEGGGWAGRFLWTLEMIGHSNWSYVDGGMVAWRNEGLPTVTAPAQVTPTRVDADYIDGPRIEIEALLAHCAAGDLQIWDARSAEEYAGLRSAARRRGHVPGAHHCEWTDLMDPDRGLRIRRDAMSRIESCGLDPNLPTATYCQTHHRSGFTWLVATLLGFNSIVAYDGSWSEWGNRDDTPVEC